MSDTRHVFSLKIALVPILVCFNAVDENQADIGTLPNYQNVANLKSCFFT